MKFLVIHLARAEPRNPIVEQLRELVPGKMDVVDAIDARKLSQSEIALLTSGPNHFPPYPFRLRASEVACFLSHRKAWRMIAESEELGAMVLEDDVVLDMPAFAKALSLVKQHAGEDSFVRFPYKNREKPRMRLAQEGETCIFEPNICGLGMQAQYVGRNAAIRLLAATERFDRPVDTTLQQTWITGQVNHTIWPSGVSEVSGDIGGSTIGQRKSLTDKLYREIARPAYRLALWAAIQSKAH
jgi:GR25 family glycosyltransferase involved in LPS biosynthesis